jgi:hypothetical protein
MPGYSTIRVITHYQSCDTRMPAPTPFWLARGRRVRYDHRPATYDVRAQPDYLARAAARRSRSPTGRYDMAAKSRHDGVGTRRGGCAGALKDGYIGVRLLSECVPWRGMERLPQHLQRAPAVALALEKFGEFGVGGAQTL